jgi:hypothetical protein
MMTSILDFKNSAFLIPIILALMLACFVGGKTGFSHPFIYRSIKPKRYWAWMGILGASAAFLTCGFLYEMTGK